MIGFGHDPWRVGLIQALGLGRQFPVACIIAILSQVASFGFSSSLRQDLAERHRPRLVHGPASGQVVFGSSGASNATSDWGDSRFGLQSPPRLLLAPAGMPALGSGLASCLVARPGRNLGP